MDVDPTHRRRIREFAVGDHEELGGLFLAVLPDFVDRLAPESSGPVEFLRDPRSFALGAYVDDVPAGLAWGVQMRYPNGRLVTYVHELDVREEYRRRGLATALVHRAIELARQRGSTRFWLSTGGHNTTAQALYESLGGVRKERGDVNFWWELG